MDNERRVGDGDGLASRDVAMLVDRHLQEWLALDRLASETIALDDVDEAFHPVKR